MYWDCVRTNYGMPCYGHANMQALAYRSSGLDVQIIGMFSVWVKS